ncbi:hypothetical protein TNCV_4350241 [Trichonephila clavipes]|nr:hypothetical protein TNCV_4350241 [Trichonephila clavipes]
MLLCLSGATKILTTRFPPNPQASREPEILCTPHLHQKERSSRLRFGERGDKATAPMSDQSRGICSIQRAAFNGRPVLRLIVAEDKITTRAGTFEMMHQLFFHQCTIT